MRSRMITLTAGDLADLLGLPSESLILSVLGDDLHRTGFVRVLVQHPSLEERRTGSSPLSVRIGNEFARMSHEERRRVMLAALLETRHGRRVAESADEQDSPASSTLPSELAAAVGSELRRSIQLDEPGELREAVTASQAEATPAPMSDAYFADRDNWPVSYEDAVDELFDAVRTRDEYPTAAELMPSTLATSSTFAFIEWALAEFRPTWQAWVILRGTPFPAANSAGNNSGRNTMFIYPRYELFDMQRSTTHHHWRNPEGFTEEQIRSSYRALVRVTADIEISSNDVLRPPATPVVEFEIVSLIVHGAPSPVLEVMNALRSHLRQPGVVQCKRCSYYVSYDGRNRLCMACGGLL